MFKKTTKHTIGEVGMSDNKSLHPSIISSGLTVTGDLNSDGEVQVDGRVEGDIRCTSLIIGVNGDVSGEVRSSSIRLHGQLTGQVFAESVFLAATARMTGDIHHHSLAIEPGAFLQGMCHRSDDEVALASASAPAIAPPDKQLSQGKAIKAGIATVDS